MDDKLRNVLKKMHYGLVGESSAVQICRWTKNSLRGDEGCWKEKFYGISSAGCCQMTPNVMNCENKCLHCWRPIEFNLGVNVETPIEPKELLAGIIKERKRLMEGFGGNFKVDSEKLKVAYEPKLYTMSLSGEPTLYPHLGELFKIIREEKRAVSFLVTNGQNPEAIKKLREDELPTQITVSTNASNKKLFDVWHRSCRENAWERFLGTLDVLRELDGKVRRVVRLTLVKKGKGETPRYNDFSNMEDEHVKEYAGLVRRANSDFVHVKGFKSVGFARERFGYDKQPWFDEVRDFAIKLETELGGFEIAGEDERSCVVMLAKNGMKLKIGKI